MSEVLKKTAVTVTRLAPAIATLAAGKGTFPALANALFSVFGAPLVDGPRVVSGNGVSFIGIGPGRWLVVGEGLDGESLSSALTRAAGASGAVCDQSDGYCVFQLAGHGVSEALAKMVLIDIEMLDSGQAATTSASLIGVTLWRPDETPQVLVAVARSYAEAFLHALSGGGME